MLVIRYNRTGRKNKPFFRLVVQEKTIAPGGRHAEVVGSWDPRAKVSVMKEDRIKYWLSVGAQPSDSVYNLLVTKGVLEGKKRSVKMSAKQSTENSEQGTGDGEEKKEDAGSEQGTTNNEQRENAEKSEDVGTEEPKDERVGKVENKEAGEEEAVDEKGQPKKE